MRTLQSKHANDIIQAWEMYSDEEYSKILSTYATATGAEIADLLHLARLEADSVANNVNYAPASEQFGDLVTGIRAYYNQDEIKGAESLSRWLLTHDYHSRLIIERFVTMALHTEKHALIEKVARKFLGKPGLRNLFIRPLFRSRFAAERYGDALKIYEKFPDQFKDVDSIQKVALAYMQTGRFNEAERVLLPIYAELKGEEYVLRFDEVQARYARVFANVEQLKKKKQRTFEESMEMGLAYLFHAKYREALTIFELLLREQAAA
ncbi:MAG: hypothetical protein KDK30_04195 [Leptospiraceae bacterium]|nr:hypothetical protein [Leptospiraceae bacterium]MCB1323486.1 hypothetical protein [Leptospiraceae bacterium]